MLRFIEQLHLFRGKWELVTVNVKSFTLLPLCSEKKSYNNKNLYEYKMEQFMAK